MSPGGYLFLWGAAHLALLPHRGGREERGGEKRLDEWRCKEEKRGSLEVQGRKSTLYWWTVVRLIDSSSYFGSKSGKVPDCCNWTANVADRGKKKFVFLPWKETGILSSKDAPTCISTENANLFGMCDASWMFGCGWQVCLCSQSPVPI